MKDKICKNCRHFKPKSITYGVKIGECNKCTSTSIPYAGDFVFTKGEPENPEPLKVCGNFGCIRFERKTIENDKNVGWVLLALLIIFVGLLYYGIYTMRHA